MKARLDFVTNSSTSSYVVGVHGELTEEKLWHMFGVTEDSLLAPLGKELAKHIVNNVQAYTREEVIAEWDELWGISPKVFDLGMTCYVGWASTEEYGIEQILCQMEIHHEDEGLIFEKESSY